MSVAPNTGHGFGRGLLKRAVTTAGDVGSKRTPDSVVSGPLLFARYAYPPNALGYCGPADSDSLLQATEAGTADGELAHLASRFEGAWPYLQLIARCNGIEDPLDRRVVEAYWIGNELVTRVPPEVLVASLSHRFERRAGRRLGSLVEAAPAGVPQHSFHVFAVYPWLGLLRAGTEGPPFEVLERCRIRWGRIECVQGEMAFVRSRTLAFDGSYLGLGPERVETVQLSRDGYGLTSDLRPGDMVSMHWGWICDRLSAMALGWLMRCTLRNLAAVNACTLPGPAVVCDS